MAFLKSKRILYLTYNKLLKIDDKLIGKFSCKGYDTYGPFKLVGGIAKGHPDEKDLTAAVDFYKEITK